MAERFTAAQADLEFRAETGTARANVDALRRDFHQATAGMSSDTLKLAVAQEKLDKALIRHGPASTQAKSAELAYRRELETTTAEVNQQNRALDRNQRELSQTARGAIVGSGAMRGLGRSVAFASGSFLGGAGLVYGVKLALDAASNLNEQTTKSEKVFEDAAPAVISFANDALGLARDQALETASSIGSLLRPLGVLPGEAAKVSVGLTKLGVDLSSFYNTPVADALDAIRSGLVGEVEPLRRYGVVLSETRVQAEALTETGKKNAKELTNEEKVRARITLIYKDSKIAAGDYADTIGGVANQEREAQKNLRNTEILLGQTLTPAYGDLLAKVNAYLGDAENQKRIQAEVNKVVRVGGQVAHGLADGLELIKEAAEPVVDALGGIENAVQIALIVGVVAKVRRSAAAFGLISTSSGVTTAKVIADAAKAEAALDAAYRPRAVVVTGPGGVPGGTPAPVPGGGNGRGKIPFTPGVNIPTAVAAAVVISGGAGYETGAYDPKKYPNIARVLAKVEQGVPLTVREQNAIAEVGGKSLVQLTAAELARLNANIGPASAQPKVGRGQGAVGAGVRTVPPNPDPAASGGGGKKPPPRKGPEPFNVDLTKTRRGRALELARLQAENTAALGDDVAANKAIASYYYSGLATVKQGTKAYNEIYALYVQANQASESAQGQIEAEKERAATAKQTQIENARRDEARRRQKLVNAVRESGVGPGQYATTRDDFSKYGVSPAEAARKTAKEADDAKGDKAATAAQIAASVHEALSAIVSIEQRYAPNFQLGRLETHAYETVHEARRQTDAIERLAARNGFPASTHSQRSALVAGA